MFDKTELFKQIYQLEEEDLQMLYNIASTMKKPAKGLKPISEPEYQPVNEYLRIYSCSGNEAAAAGLNSESWGFAPIDRSMIILNRDHPTYHQRVQEMEYLITSDYVTIGTYSAAPPNRRKIYDVVLEIQSLLEEEQALGFVEAISSHSLKENDIESFPYAPISVYRPLLRKYKKEDAMMQMFHYGIACGKSAERRRRKHSQNKNGQT